MSKRLHDWDFCYSLGEDGAAVINHTLVTTRGFLSVQPVSMADQRSGIDYILHDVLGEFRAEYKTDTWNTPNLALEDYHEYPDGERCTFQGWVWKERPHSVFYLSLARELIFQLDAGTIRSNWAAVCRAAKRNVACQNRGYTTYCRITPITFLRDRDCIIDEIPAVFPNQALRERLLAAVH